MIEISLCWHSFCIIAGDFAWPFLQQWACHAYVISVKEIEACIYSTAGPPTMEVAIRRLVSHQSPIKFSGRFWKIRDVDQLMMA